MALNDVFQLTDIQTYGTEVVENVYFFHRLDPAGNADDLITGFISDYIPAIRDIQGFLVEHTEIKAQSLGDLSDFADQVVTLTGLAGAVDLMPSFVSVGYTLKPNTRAVRPGSKRYTGVPEAVVTYGDIVEPTYLTKVEALRVKLDDNIAGALAEYEPVIVKRIKTPIEDTMPVQYRYSLPGVGDTLVLGLIKQALSNTHVTSQVSRKF